MWVDLAKASLSGLFGMLELCMTTKFSYFGTAFLPKGAKQTPAILK